jgi:hypothetical protein
MQDKNKAAQSRMVARGIGGTDFQVMAMDRPMNEYEAALHTALMVLVQAMTKGETDKSSLVRGLRSAARTYTDFGHKNGAGVLEILASVIEDNTGYIPKPPFEVIQGGKTDPENSN